MKRFPILLALLTLGCLCGFAPAQVFLVPAPVVTTYRVPAPRYHLVTPVAAAAPAQAGYAASYRTVCVNGVCTAVPVEAPQLAVAPVVRTGLFGRRVYAPLVIYHPAEVAGP